MRRDLRSPSVNVRWHSHGRSILGITCLGVAGLIAALAGGAPAAGAAGACSNEALRAQQDARVLSDCRAWEMVSPVDKRGSDIAPAGAAEATGGAIASASGASAIYVSEAAFSDPVAGGLPSYYFGAREGGTWSSRQVNTYQEPHGGLGYAAPVLAFNPDFSKQLVASRSILAEGATAVPGVPNLYLRNLVSGAVKLIVPSTAPLPFGNPRTQFLEASPDLSHVLIKTPGVLTSDASPGMEHLYLWVDGAIPETRLVAEGLSGVLELWSNGAPTTAGGRYNMISDEGSRVLFIPSESDAAFEPIGDIYMSEDGEAPVEISASQRSPTDPNGPRPAIFGAATPDLEYVFFTSGEKLTQNATTGPSSGGNDLYRYQTSTGDLVDLTVEAEEPSSPNGAEVTGPGSQTSGVIAVGNDGATVYFAAKGDLAAGATAGAVNLYVWREGEVSHIATGTIAENGSSRSLAVASPSGRYLVFASTGSLTGQATAGFRQVYRYDAVTNELDCASCDPSGAAATADAELMHGYTFQSMSTYARRYITDDGSVFFDTPQALLPGDTNGKQDVYEFSDVGLALLSSGRSEDASSFYDASASGGDVFFSTRERLVSADPDGLMDIYDARVNGGLATQNLPPAPPPCAGEACRGPSPAAPPAAVVASSAVVGPGNVRPKRSKHHPKKRRATHHKKAGKKKSHSRGRGAGARHGNHHATSRNG